MSSTSFTEITYEVEGPAAILTLNRPERLNAFTGTMMNEMIAAFDLADEDDDDDVDDEEPRGDYRTLVTEVEFDLDPGDRLN
jgi:hypothetical protein